MSCFHVDVGRAEALCATETPFSLTISLVIYVIDKKYYTAVLNILFGPYVRPQSEFVVEDIYRTEL